MNQTRQQKDQDWLESCHSPISHQDMFPGLLRRGTSTSDFLKHKDAFVNILALPLFCLSSLDHHLMPKVLSLAAFWVSYLIPFACNNHHFRPPARKGHDKQKEPKPEPLELK